MTLALIRAVEWGLTILGVLLVGAFFVVVTLTRHTVREAKKLDP